MSTSTEGREAVTDFQHHKIANRLRGMFDMSVKSEDDFNRLSPAGFRLLRQAHDALLSAAPVSPASVDATADGRREAEPSIDLMQRVWANLFYDEAEAGFSYQGTLNDVVDWLAARGALPDADNRTVMTVESALSGEIVAWAAEHAKGIYDVTDDEVTVRSWRDRGIVVSPLMRVPSFEAVRVRAAPSPAEAPAEAVRELTRIKPLEWVKPHGAETLCRAETSFGTYYSWTHFEAEGAWFWECCTLLGSHAHGGEGRSETEVQSAAFADYEGRVLRCLTGEGRVSE